MNNPIGSPEYSRRRPSVPPTSIARARLNALLGEIDARVDAIGRRLATLDANGYEHQELGSERQSLLGRRRVVAAQIEALDPPPMTPADRAAYEAWDRRVTREVADRRESRQHFIDKLTASGDHREARVQRDALLNLRAEVEREWPAP